MALAPIYKLPPAVLAHALSYLSEECQHNRVNRFFNQAGPLACREILHDLSRQPQLRMIFQHYLPPPRLCPNWDIFCRTLWLARLTYHLRNGHYQLGIENTKQLSLVDLANRTDAICFTRLFKKLVEALHEQTPSFDIAFQKNWIQTHKEQLESITKLELGDEICTVGEELGLLKNLTYLDLASTDQREVPDSLREMHQLRSLYLNDNKIRTLPLWLGSFEDLNALYLDSNKISDLPRECEKLGRLNILYLNDNDLQAPPLCISRLPLITLKLSENPLEIPPLFVFPPSLRTLTLSKCRLTHFPPIKNLVQLEQLDISKNKIRYIPKWINKFQSLDFLKLSYNPIFLRKEIGQLARLRVLSMSHLNLTHLPYWINRLQSLEIIYIGYNLFTHLPPALYHLNRLRQLLMPSTLLHYIPPWVMQLQFLEIADFTNTPTLRYIPEHYFLSLPHFQTLFR